jgi:hypothetical protein
MKTSTSGIIMLVILIGIGIGFDLLKKNPDNSEPYQFSMGQKVPLVTRGLGSAESPQSYPRIELNTRLSTGVNYKMMKIILSTYDELKNNNLLKTIGFFEVLQSENEICIYKYIGDKAHLNIPDVIDDIPVKYIMNVIFDNPVTVNSIVIPDTVDGIAAKAFDNCENLQEIQLPSRLMHTGISLLDEYYISEGRKGGLYIKNAQNIWTLKK